VYFRKSSLPFLASPVGAALLEAGVWANSHAPASVTIDAAANLINVVMDGIPLRPLIYSTSIEYRIRS
jgi:hypothetical protein